MSRSQHRGDDLQVDVRQRNDIFDDDDNLNSATVDQQARNGGDDGPSPMNFIWNYGRENDAEVDQDIDSGNNRQRNDADLDHLRTHDDLSIVGDQSNMMSDDDINTNLARVTQRGRGDNDSYVDQDIDSDGNHQSNDLDVDHGGGNGPLFAWSGYNGRGDIEIDARQGNTLTDDDDNLNEAAVTQTARRYGDNDAEVDQDIDSGDNHQSNRVDLDLGRHSGGEYDVEQINWMRDNDINTNRASVDQTTANEWGDNWADVDQNIDSGDNSQSNSFELDFG